MSRSATSHILVFGQGLTFFQARNERALCGLAIERLENWLHEAVVVDQNAADPHKEIAIFGNIEVIHRLDLIGGDRIGSRPCRPPLSIDRRP